MVILGEQWDDWDTIQTWLKDQQEKGFVKSSPELIPSGSMSGERSFKNYVKINQVVPAFESCFSLRTVYMSGKARIDNSIFLKSFSAEGFALPRSVIRDFFRAL